jgi:hypothetical protein
VKSALRAVLPKQLVAESILRTALVEIEAVLNSHPLTQNSADPDDFTAITPNHFLIGRADNVIPPVSVSSKEINSRKRWRQVQVIADHVSRRWLQEYLPTLTLRSKWSKEVRNVNIGDLVLLVDDNLPRGAWELARVVDVYPGDDGRVRTALVKTPRTTYVRPVCVLEERPIE